jgi:4-amino-4-deoxy-L-arabinose transferase-like glycosyltransferase
VNQHPQPHSGESRFPVRAAHLLPVILLLVYLAQCVWFLRTQSFTYDEPVHIAEGLEAWRHGRFEQYNDQPPLARLWCTLPLLGQKWQVEVRQFPDSFSIPAISPDPVSMAWRARAMIVVLGILLGFLVWSAAKKFFSEAAANFALALFAFSPSLIAHFSLATTDGAATLLIFAAAWQLVRWRHHSTWKATLLLGGTLGLLLLAKFSTLAMFVLALGWMLVLSSGNILFHPRKWNWRKTAAALAVAVLVVWTGYFFHVARLTVRDGTLTAAFPNWHQAIVKPVHSRLNYSLLIPAGEYIEGLREVVRHNGHGQAAFFLGHVSPTGGWKLYYPVTILLKWPPLVLILGITGLLLASARKIRLPADLWIMASFPALYFALAIFARFNIGERHVLPVYPFVLLFAAAVWQATRPRPAAAALLILLAGLNAADALRYAPDSLSYFNILVPSSQSYRFLTDSNLDWGQGLLALRNYEAQHSQEPIWLAYFGSVDPRVYGIQALRLPQNQQVTGTVVVSATDLSGQFLSDPDGYRWLLAYQPDQILDHSLFVFHVHKARTGFAP